ncbi:MAG TPA: YkgJ family cysteine cluster protein [Planctomycetaceae bacterium]|nr:YkgJ family cysteine cluster protein [Planctomycetaceae bacterium]
MLPLQLPTIQNWDCHNCGGCCTQHLIEVTEAERQRILAQNWTPADGIPAGQPLFEWHAGPPWKKRYRLAHRPDGGCVFLDDKGLCRIHAKFGEAAKPLACRIYPYAFHPQGKSVTVSLRSVARRW